MSSKDRSSNEEHLKVKYMRHESYVGLRMGSTNQCAMFRSQRRSGHCIDEYSLLVGKKETGKYTSADLSLMTINM